MDFEPAAAAPIDQLSRDVSIMLESGFSIRKGNFLIRLLTRNLIRNLIVLCNNTARTTLLIVARADRLVLKTASALMILSRRKGGSK